MKRGWYALMLVVSVLVGAWAGITFDNNILNMSKPASAPSPAPSASSTPVVLSPAPSTGDAVATPTPSAPPRATPAVAVPIIFPDGETVKERFSPPAGYTRPLRQAGSIVGYLMDLPLKPDGSPVLLYDGTEKELSVYEAVVDMPVGTRNHQQAVGSVERIYAQYLYANGLEDNIVFHFTSGFKFDWKTWASGRKLKVDGSKVSFTSGGTKSTGEENFEKYLVQLMQYNSIKALASDVEDASDLAPGVMLYQNAGTDKSHVVMIMDMCENENGDKLYILGQGFKPAQEMHILKNVQDASISPWVQLSSSDTTVKTPEFTFDDFKFVQFK